MFLLFVGFHHSLWMLSILPLLIGGVAAPAGLYPRGFFFLIIPVHFFFSVCNVLPACSLHARRGLQISLQMVVSRHMVAENWTQDLWKSSQCSLLLSHLSSPQHNSYFSYLLFHLFELELDTFRNCLYLHKTLFLNKWDIFMACFTVFVIGAILRYFDIFLFIDHILALLFIFLRLQFLCPVILMLLFTALDISVSSLSLRNFLHVCMLIRTSFSETARILYSPQPLSLSS